MQLPLHKQSVFFTGCSHCLITVDAGQYAFFRRKGDDFYANKGANLNTGVLGRKPIVKKLQDNIRVKL
ncbi:MAG: hypothetical protein ABIQ88_23035 [Chitinophagaceae bacterium]